jgi:septal ring factor EnvC (AmiA/AmiB activator)
MEEIFLLIQKTYGIAGLILLSPFVGLVVMFRQNVRLQGDVVKATVENVESQKQRVKDAQDISNKLLEVVKEQSSLNTETNIALERIGDALNEIQSKFMQGR